MRADPEPDQRIAVECGYGSVTDPHSRRENQRVVIDLFEMESRVVLVRLKQPACLSRLLLDMSRQSSKQFAELPGRAGL